MAGEPSFDQIPLPSAKHAVPAFSVTEGTTAARVGFLPIWDGIAGRFG